MARRRHHRRRQIPNGSIAWVDKTKRLRCEQDDVDGHNVAHKAMRCSAPDLPEDILLRIHSLMPLRDAARAACLSHAFLHSWRCRPTLILNRHTIGLKSSACGGILSHKIDSILRKHSGIGIKTFKLEYLGITGFDSSRYLENWLQVAVKPGIRILSLMLSKTKREYNFPCSVLPEGIWNTIRYLKLANCAFRPTAELAPMKILRILDLCNVSITGDELERLLSNSFSLETLRLAECNETICLKIPCRLLRLRCLAIRGCSNLQVIENKAPNLSSFYLTGLKVKFTLGEALQMKKLVMLNSYIAGYPSAELLPSMPNLETLTISLEDKMVGTKPTEFFYLKHLTIYITRLSFSPNYDYFSLVSFLNASPALETLILDLSQQCVKHESIFAHPSLRKMPEWRHCCLKSVKITCFSSAKSLVELTCYILKNAVSLECLTLDTIYGYRCSDKKYTSCQPMTKDILLEAAQALLAIKTYIENKAPSVKLTVLGPCRRCHDGNIMVLQ